ncbi:MAG: preprotein translocase subunit SecY [Proteobacteria bacterium]|nr:preprotein translocase subunit SecY [Pseudomonadota bacterium]
MSSFAGKIAANLESGLMARSAELRQRIWFTILVLIVYRIGSYIPLPGIDVNALSGFADQQAGGVLGMLNMFTGGALARMSIFALNIMPYITASIVMQIMGMVSEDLANLKKEGEAGRRKITQYTRYLTVILALVQGYGIGVGIEAAMSGNTPVVYSPGFFFRLTAMFSLMGGTVFVMWLGEQISARGIGNGSSLIIFTGIVSGLPMALAAFFEMGRSGVISVTVIMAVLAMAVALVYAIVFVEKGQRRIVVQYPKRQIGNKMYGGESTHMPLKINTSGVIPPIFASAILLFPATIAGFSGKSGSSWWHELIATYLAHGKPAYIVLYVLLIIGFSFFYTSVVFNPEETAENLRKNGGVVVGRRPGKPTAEYFDEVLTKLTVIGSLYVAAICIIPEILISRYAVPFYLGGTSLLIMVNVVIDLFTQVQAQLLSARYEGLLKKAKFGGRL